MNNSPWLFVVTAAYFVIFFVGVGGIGIWTIKRRRERPPLEFKLLRGPGETLRQRVAKFDEDSFFKIGAAAMVPFLAAVTTFAVVAWLAGQMRGQALAAAWLVRLHAITTYSEDGPRPLGRGQRLMTSRPHSNFPIADSTCEEVAYTKFFRSALKTVE